MRKSVIEDIWDEEVTKYAEKTILQCIIVIQTAVFIEAAPIALRLSRQIRQFVISTHNNATSVGAPIHP